MTHKLIAFLIIGAFLVTTLACVCPLGQQGGATSQPTVQIAQPAEGAVVAPGQAVPIVAVASDPAGLTRLEVEVDGAVLVTQTSPQPAPNLAASTTWSSTATGHHVILARAFNAKGQATQSTPVVVLVQTTSAQGVTPESITPSPTVPPPIKITPTPTATIPPPPPENRAPVVNSLTVNPQTVPAGSSAALAVSAVDPDGDPLSYSWDVPAGRGAVAGGANATYTAPMEPSKSGACTITAIVSDDKGAVATKSVVITVVRPGGLYDPGPDFQATWGSDPAVQDELGWATQAQRTLAPNASGPQAAEQPFQNGRMFWFGDVRMIYTLYSPDHKWQLFNDTFNWEDPAPTPLPPTGCTAPVQGGFRKVWWNEVNVRARIGCPLQAEQGVTGVVQTFQRGVMIKSGLTGQVFVLFSMIGPEGTWQ